MTEIKAGTDFNLSRKLAEQMQQAAKDGSVTKDEITQLKTTATNDASGLTAEETDAINSLDVDAGTSSDVVSKNIQSLQNLAAHDAEASSVDFSGLNLITEKKNFLASASFGLFGGKTQSAHAVKVQEGDIPAFSNPAEPSTMQERQQTERENLVKMLVPLEQELNSNSPELRQRVATMLDVAPDSPAVTQKINDLARQIQSFKNDPNAETWQLSGDVNALLDSYSQNPPTEGSSRLSAGYMSAVRGAIYNASDSSRLAQQETEKIAAGEIVIPASQADIKSQLDQADKDAREKIQNVVETTESFINNLDALEKSDPIAYKNLMNGISASDVDALRRQIDGLKAHVASGAPITQEQMNQLNMLWGGCDQLQKTLKFPAADSTQRQDLERQLQEATTLLSSEGPEEMMAAVRQNVADIESQIALLPPASEQNPLLASVKDSQQKLTDAVNSGYWATEKAATQRSSMIAELEHAETTLSNLVANPSLSENGRAQLQQQLDATRSAIATLKEGGNPSLTGDQEKALQQVLSGLQSLKPATAAPVTQIETAGPAEACETDKTAEVCVAGPSVAGDSTSDLLASISGGTVNAEPELFTSPLLLNPMPLAANANLFGAQTGTSNLLNISNPSLTSDFLLDVPELTYGASSLNPSLFDYGGGYDFLSGGYSPTFSYGFPTLLPPSTWDMTPLPAATQDSASGTPTRPSLESAFLNNIGEQVSSPEEAPATLSPAQEEALGKISTLQSIPGQNPRTISQLDTLGQLVRNPSTSETAGVALEIYESRMAQATTALQKEEAALFLDLSMQAIKANEASPEGRTDAAQLTDQIRKMGEKTSVSQTLENNKLETGTAQLQERLTTVTQSADKASVALQQIVGDMQIEAKPPQPLAVTIATGPKAAQFVENVDQLLGPLNTELETKNRALLAAAGVTSLPEAERILAARRSNAKADPVAAAAAATLLDARDATKAQVDALFETRTHITAVQGRDADYTTAATHISNEIKTLEAELAAATEAKNTAQVAFLTGRIETLNGELGLVETAQTQFREKGQVSPETLPSVLLAADIRNTDNMITAFDGPNRTGPERATMDGYRQEYQGILARTDISAEDKRDLLFALRGRIAGDTHAGRLKAPSAQDQRILAAALTGGVTPAGGTPAGTPVEGAPPTDGNSDGPVDENAPFGVQNVPSGTPLDESGGSHPNAPAGGVIPDLVAALNVTPAAVTQKALELETSFGHGNRRVDALLGGRPAEYAAAAIVAASPEAADVLSSPAFLAGLPPTVRTQVEAGITSAASEENAYRAAFDKANTMTIAAAIEQNIPGAADVQQISTGNIQQWEALDSMGEDERNRSLAAKKQQDFALTQMFTEMAQRNNERVSDMREAQQASNATYTNLLFGADSNVGDAKKNDMSAADLDARTQAMIDEANELGNTLDLTPMPAVNSEDLFSQWLSDTLNIIRGADEKMRQVILAQLALKMIDQVIGTFYKNRNDENSEYHQKQLAGLSSERNQIQNQLNLNQQVSTAANSQAVASVGSGASGAARAEGFNLNATRDQSVDQMRQQVRQVLQDLPNSNPSLNITGRQVDVLTAQFDAILKAGQTTSVSDDRAAILNMSHMLRSQSSLN